MNQTPPHSLTLGGWNANELNGTQLGSCVLERPLGVGGMGAVFLARQTRPKRQVAVKLIRPLASATPDAWKVFMARFRREADATAALDHANIVPIYEFGEDGAMAYLVMPYLADGSLAALLTRDGRLPLRRALSYLDQTAAALDCAHKNGIIHRDVKPSNLLRHPDGRLMLADFGIARLLQTRDTPLPMDQQSMTDGSLTMAGVAMGTPEYMAPELIRGEPVTPLVDIYSLATVGYAMLAGRTPFGGGDVPAILARQVREAPPPLRALAPDTPPEIERVLMWALAKNPADRPQSAKEFAHALRAAGASMGIPGLATGAHPVPPRGGSRSAGRTLGGAFGGAFGGALAGAAAERGRAVQHTEALPPTGAVATFGQGSPGDALGQSIPGDATIYDPAIATGPRRAAGNRAIGGPGGMMGGGASGAGGSGGGVPVWPGMNAGAPPPRSGRKRRGLMTSLLFATAGAVVVLLLVLMVGTAMGDLMNNSSNKQPSAVLNSKTVAPGSTSLPTVTPSPTIAATQTPVPPANWLSATPDNIHLSCGSGGSSAMITLTNQGPRSLEWNEQMTGGSGITFSRIHGTIPAYGSMTIKVSYKGTLFGRQGTITFSPTNDQAGDPATVNYQADPCF